MSKVTVSAVFFIVLTVLVLVIVLVLAEGKFRGRVRELRGLGDVAVAASAAASALEAAPRFEASLNVAPPPPLLSFFPSSFPTGSDPAPTLAHASLPTSRLS